jgi:DNA-binding IclR family transcriptional regulator
VYSPTGEVVGALTIAAVESRLPKERQQELGKQLLDEAKRVEMQLARAASMRPEPKAKRTIRSA